MNSGGCPQNWVQTFFVGCLSYMNNPAKGFLLRHVLKDTGVSGLFRQGLVQQEEAGCDVLILLRRSHRHHRWTISTKALLTSLSVFYVYGTAFSSWDICFLYYFLFNVIIIHLLWRISCCFLTAPPPDFLRSLVGTYGQIWRNFMFFYFWRSGHDLLQLYLMWLQHCLPLKLQKCFVDTNISPTPPSA